MDSLITRATLVAGFLAMPLIAYTLAQCPNTSANNIVCPLISESITCPETAPVCENYRWVQRYVNYFGCKKTSNSQCVDSRAENVCYEEGDCMPLSPTDHHCVRNDATTVAHNATLKQTLPCQ
jgi:hypothetical protein